MEKSTRTTIKMPVGPMATRGDLQGDDAAKSPGIRNMFFRRKQADKRLPFRKHAIFKDGTGGTIDGQVGNLFVKKGIDTADVLIASGQYWDGVGVINLGDAHYINGATWTAFNDVDAISDAANYSGSIYMLTGGLTSGAYATRTVKWDGTTETNNALTSQFSGNSIASFIGRLFIAGPIYPKSTDLNGGSYLYKFNDNTEWTVTGSWTQPVLANNVCTATVAHATNDKIKTAAAIITSAATETYYTAQFWIQSASPTNNTPITIRLEDSAGTTIYGYAEYVIPKVGDDANWRQYTVQGRIPASTAVYLSLQMGNTSGGATVGAKLRLSDRTTVTAIPCAQIFPGRYAFPYYATTSSAVVDASLSNRIVWSEALDPNDWRNESYAVCDDSPGAITAVRAVNGKLIVFKRNSIYTFRPTQSNVSPVVREGFLPGIGTFSPASIVDFDNKLVFIADNEIYIYDGSSEPKPICGPDMKDEILGSSSEIVAEPLLAIDEYNHELWVYTKGFKLFVYSMESESWIGYTQFTDSTGSDTPFNSTGGGEIDGLVYYDGSMWANVMIAGEATSEDTYSICRQSGNTGSGEVTLDDIDGTERDVKAWYTFHVLETERPRKQITLQSVGLDHKITGSQAASTTRYAVSIDGGSTWVNYNEMTAYPLSSGADPDTKVMRAYVHQTAPRIVFRIEHEGAAGPSYFNITGAEAGVIIRGTAIQYPNPTNGASSL